jgi:hypothetical protein
VQRLVSSKHSAQEGGALAPPPQAGGGELLLLLLGLDEANNIISLVKAKVDENTRVRIEPDDGAIIIDHGIKAIENLDGHLIHLLSSQRYILLAQPKKEGR